MAIDKISFQNGFICGMATKGLTRSGEQYKPIIWNDTGIYTFFYIDFKQGLAEFSLGMLKQSMIVYDSQTLPITDFEKVSDTVYKIYCDISGIATGISVINKATSLLETSTGYKVKPFAVLFYVSGIEPTHRLGYIFNKANFPDIPFIPSEHTEFGYSQQYTMATITDTIDFSNSIVESRTTSENTIISYWAV